MLDLNIDHFDVPDLIRRIKELEEPSRAIDGEIACLIDYKFPNGKYAGEYLPLNSFEDIACFAHPEGVPKFTEETTAAEILVGPREFPFVYTVITDFGGLCRARVSNGLNIQVQSDGFSTAAALCAAALEAQYNHLLSQGTEE